MGTTQRNVMVVNETSLMARLLAKFGITANTDNNDAMMKDLMRVSPNQFFKSRATHKERRKKVNRLHVSKKVRMRHKNH